MTGKGKELKETTASEQVEIGRVYMVGIGEFVSGASEVNPLVGNSGKAVFVDLDGPFGEGATSQDARVVSREEDEAEDGNGQPPEGKPMFCESQPDNCDSNREDSQAHISETDVDAFEFRYSRLSRCQPGCVFLCRVHVSECNRRI